MTSNELSVDDDCPNCNEESLEADIWTTVDANGRHHTVYHTCTSCEFNSRLDDVEPQTA